MNRFTKALPTILSIVSVAGVAATTVLAVKATPKAMKLIKEREDKKDDILTKREVVKTTWKCYIPSAAVFVGTTACIIGANILNKRSQASIAAAYALVSSSYNKYKGKVVELYGKEAHNKIISSIAAEKSDPPLISAMGIFSDGSTLEFGDNDEEVTFYDVFSQRYFTSTVNKVLQAEYHLNRNFVLRGGAELNEFYDFLGIKPIDGGDSIGWSCGENMYWIDFNHRKVTLDDGLEVRFIEMIFEPYNEYYDEIEGCLSTSD